VSTPVASAPNHPPARVPNQPGYATSCLTRAAKATRRQNVHQVDVLAQWVATPRESESQARQRLRSDRATPNVIMNDIRLRGLAIAGGDAAGRRDPYNHAQTARNLKRAVRNAAAEARLIQAEGLDNKSAAAVAASLADALEELHRLQRSLDRRIRREQGRLPKSPPAS
jgi:hypothetical protein